MSFLERSHSSKARSECTLAWFLAIIGRVAVWGLA